METEEILSCGIDIGTSTTELVISRLTLETSKGFGKIPEIKIAKRDVIYKSDIYFTPLLSGQEIDAQGVIRIISDEYEKAGVRAGMLKTGAVIITGESSRKKNAREVSEAVSAFSGNFTAAVCGPDLEGILAAKGSGALRLSLESGLSVMNLDIGGGTTNICVFENGKAAGTACLDIGGRLVRINNKKISYIAPKIKALTPLREGDGADMNALNELAGEMADLAAQAAGLIPAGDELEYIKTNRLLSSGQSADIFTFSGGVAGCMEEEGKDPFRYGDIGPILAEALKEHDAFRHADVRIAAESRRATVIGAGNYALSLSGSTVEYSKEALPLKNIPVVKVALSGPEDIEKLDTEIEAALNLLEGQFPLALFMEGLECPSFNEIQAIAGKICKAADRLYPAKAPLIVIFKNDMAKAAGQAVKRLLKDSREFISIDGVQCETGDYIDLGQPFSGGRAVPVTVKTLVFTS